MSHSLREILRSANRFDTFSCAHQIAKSVSRHALTNAHNMSNTIYSYDGDCVEVYQGKLITRISDRLEGEFFDTFPDVDVEVRVGIDRDPDIDGLYYHTSDDDDTGLIEILVVLSERLLTSIKREHLTLSIQSLLVHEMQHVIQKCHLGLEMNHIPKNAFEHLTDPCEVDARVEEVVCGMSDETDTHLFETRMERYLDEFYKRNSVDDPLVDRLSVLGDHIDFYNEKILGHLH